MRNLQKISSIILYLLLGLSVVIAILYFFGGNSTSPVTTMVEKRFTNLAMIWCIVLFAIATLITILFSVMNIFASTRTLKSFLVILGIAVVLILVSYLLASSEPLPNVQVDVPPTAATLKLVGAGLTATFILAGVALLSIIVLEVYRSVK